MSDYTIDELMAARIAAEVEDTGITVFGSFTPLAYAAYVLALKTHASNAVVVGFNAIGIEPVELSITGMWPAPYPGNRAR